MVLLKRRAPERLSLSTGREQLRRQELFADLRQASQCACARYCRCFVPESKAKITLTRWQPEGESISGQQLRVDFVPSLRLRNPSIGDAGMKEVMAACYKKGRSRCPATASLSPPPHSFALSLRPPRLSSH